MIDIETNEMANIYNTPDSYIVDLIKDFTYFQIRQTVYAALWSQAQVK